MKNVASSPRCLPNNVIDPQCIEYISDSGTYKCNQCNLLYTLSSVYKTDGTFSNCLLVNSQVIRDCALYEILSGGGYECKQCSASENIARYGFILNGVQAYRCLNTVSEHVDSCTTYKYENQNYECTLCDSGYLRSDVQISNAEKIRCLSTSNQVVEDCKHYDFDKPSAKYVCN